MDGGTHRRAASGARPEVRPNARAAMVSESDRVTSELLWRATLIAVVIDIPALVLVGRAVSTMLFTRLKWYLVGAAFVVYAALWGTFGSVLFWGSVYQAVFPSWSRWLLPLWFGCLFGLLALAFWRVCRGVGIWPAAWFSLLGGLASLVGHSIGIRRGLLRVPLLEQASPASALVFGVFEFILYWCGIVGLAAAARAGGHALHRKAGVGWSATSRRRPTSG